MKQKIYTIPVFWDSWGVHKVKAASLKEAMQKSDNMGLPEKMEYIDDSYKFDMEGITIHNKKILTKADKKLLEGRDLYDGTTIADLDL
jgi:Zn/Cd-binding protein ZinT